MTYEPLVSVIDPDGAERDSLASMLNEVNLTCKTFRDAEQFFAAQDAPRLGCVLSELKLGSTTALQLVKRLRQRGSSLPVILVTSYATVPLVAQAFKAGLFDVVVKPCDAFQLWECATRAFEFHHGEMTDSH